MPDDFSRPTSPCAVCGAMLWRAARPGDGHDVEELGYSALAAGGAWVYLWTCAACRSGCLVAVDVAVP